MFIERLLMYLDAALAGMYLCWLSLSLWPSVDAIGGNMVSNLFGGGVRRGIEGLALTIFGFAVAKLFLPIQFIPDCGLVPTALSVLFVITYIAIVSYSARSTLEALRTATHSLSESNRNVRKLLRHAEDARHRAEEAQARSEQMHRRLSGIGQMAASIVHDLKNPIGVIKGCAEMADEDDTPRTDRQEYLRMIRQEADRLGEMAFDILGFARGRAHLEIQSVDPGTYFAEIEQFALKATAARLYFQLAGKVPRSEPDRRGKSSRLLMIFVIAKFQGLLLYNL